MRTKCTLEVKWQPEVIMRKIAVRGAMQPSVTVTSYYRNAHLKTLNVKVILHYLLFIYLCDITE